jgi:hypothetical protein
MPMLHTAAKVLELSQRWWHLMLLLPTRLRHHWRPRLQC